MIRHSFAFTTIALTIASTARAGVSLDDAKPEDKTKCDAAVKRLVQEGALAADPNYATAPCTYLGISLSQAIRTSVKTAADKKQKDAVKPVDDAAQAPRAVQPIATQSPGSQGSPGQIEAVPTTMPISLAGGAISVAGTKTGSRLVASLGFNPWALVRDKSADEAALPFRMLDVSVNLPANVFQTVTTGSAIDYVGVRLRVNASALWTSDTAKQAVKEAVAAVKARVIEAVKVDDDLDAALYNAPDVATCFKALQTAAKTNDTTAVPEACGKHGVDTAALEKAELVAQDAIDRARVKEDPYFLGIDTRFDFGDPTLQGVSDAFKNFSMVAAAAVGLRRPIGTSGAFFDLRGRLGFAYASTPTIMTAPTVTSVDWGASIGGGFAKSIDPISFTIGVEGRNSSTGPSMNSLAPTNFVNLRLGAGVPVPMLGTLGFGISVPLGIGDLIGGPAMVTISGNWGLLAPLLASK